MNNKLTISVILGILFISLASASFLPIKTYDEETDTVTLSNFLGLGKDYVTAQLIWGDTKVGVGVDTHVGTFNYTPLDEDSYISDLDLIDLKNDNVMTRGKQYKVLTWKEDDIYETVCDMSEDKNGYEIYNSCEEVEIGKKTVEEWMPLNSWLKKNNFIVGETYSIGVFVDTEEGDYGDWIPTLMGFEVDKWATWNATFETDLEYWWSFEEASGDLIDVFSYTNNGSVDGSTYEQTGIIDYGYDFDGTNDKVTIGNFDFGSNDAITISMWVKAPKDSTYRTIVDTGLVLFGKSDGDYPMVNRGGAGDERCNTSINDDAWTHIVWTVDNSGSDCYIDGYFGTTSVSGSTIVYSELGNGNEYIGAYDSGQYFDGMIDEIGYWTRKLSASEILDLYNEGNGLQPLNVVPDNVPVLEIYEPENNTNYTQPAVEFIAYVEDDRKVENVSLFIDGVLDQTNSSEVNGTNYTFSKSLETGLHNWSIIAYDNASQSNESGLRFVNITIVPPTIQLSIPLDNVFTTTVSQTFYAYVTDNLKVENVSFYWDGSLDQTDSSGTNGTNYTFSKTLTEGSHTWYIQAYDNDTYDSTSATRTITLDTTYPEVFASNLTDINTFILPTNSTWYYNTYDANIDLCYYNTTGYPDWRFVTCNSSITSTQWTTTGNKTIQYCANDTLGHETCRTDYIYVYEIHAQDSSSSASVDEGFDVTFNLTVNRTNSIPSTIANFQINGTNYTVYGSLSGNEYYFEKTITVPNTWGSLAGNTVYWMWFYNITGVGNYNTTPTGLQVFEFSIDDCSTNTVPLFNFTLVDEKTKLNFTGVNNETSEVEAEIVIFAEGGTTQIANVTSLYNNTNPVLICTNHTLVSNYYTNSLIRYKGSSHANEFYYLDNSSLTTANTPINITLYDLDNDSSTTFKITYKDENYLPVADALISVQRKYVSEGLYRTVEAPLTDSNGQTLIHLEVEDAIYRFIMSRDGTILSTFDSAGVKCSNSLTGDCNLNFNAVSTAIPPEDYTSQGDFSFTITYTNSTRTVSSIFSSTSVTTGRLNVTLADGSDTYVCSNEVTSTSGTLSCVVPSSVGNETIIIRIYSDDEYQGQATKYIGYSPTDLYGSSVVFLTIFLYLTLIGIGVSDNPLITGLFMVIGGILAITMNLVNGGNGIIGAGATVLWLIIAVIIVLIKGSRRG
jgi:hypothetical protein